MRLVARRPRCMGDPSLLNPVTRQAAGHVCMNLRAEVYGTMRQLVGPRCMESPLNPPLWNPPVSLLTSAQASVCPVGGRSLVRFVAFLVGCSIERTD